MNEEVSNRLAVFLDASQHTFVSSLLDRNCYSILSLPSSLCASKTFIINTSQKKEKIRKVKSDDTRNVEQQV